MRAWNIAGYFTPHTHVRLDTEVAFIPINKRGSLLPWLQSVISSNATDFLFD
jgi:hypothetical protein